MMCGSGVLNLGRYRCSPEITHLGENLQLWNTARTSSFIRSHILLYVYTGSSYTLTVKGGAMKDHRGGGKMYHQAPLCSINVRANC